MTLFFNAVVVPVLSVDSTTATSISLSWTSAGLDVTSYELMWQRDTLGECSDVGGDSLTLTSTNSVIMGLEEDSIYSATVIANNVAVSRAVSDAVTAMTLEAGEK